VGAAVLPVALVVLLLVGARGTASAASTCTYDGTDSVTVTIGTAEAVSLAIGKTAGRSIDFAVGSDAYAQCGTATSKNTTTIEVTASAGNETFTLDQTGSAAFPSGAIKEIAVDMGDGTDTFAITGKSDADKIRFGAGGVNLNSGAGTSVDLTLAGTQLVVVRAGDAADKVGGQGGRGTGDAYTGKLHLYGGPGDDTLTGGEANDLVSGGDGNDAIDGGGGADEIVGGVGKDVLRGVDGRDTIKGSLGDDTVYGGNGADSLFGGKGDDVLYGGPGIDTCSGGPGADAWTGCEKH
jgi:Ca2+-binding RTX toxin-like protein